MPGRGNGTPSTLSFILETAGLCLMCLVYDQVECGGNIEFYSSQGGTPILINDPANSSSSWPTAPRRWCCQ